MSMDRCYYLTEGVLFDILLYLPVMSLLRFKAVCKYWFSLIESSDFISEHLNHNREGKEDNFIILGHFNNEQKIALLGGSKYEDCVFENGIEQFWHPVSLMCCCNGLILCLGPEYEITLWNPALKQLKPIPPPLLSDRLCMDTSVILEEDKLTTFNVSFGIDVKSSEYKLVGIMLEYSGNWDLTGSQVDVYNVGGDNSWRIIHKNDVLPFVDLHCHYSISSDKSGKCFWIASRYDKTPILLSFDFSDDVFRTMLLPVGVVEYIHFDLDFLDEKVVYIVAVAAELDKVDKFFEIWMLHEFGVEESWNIIYKVGPFMQLGHFCSQRISKNGEFLICYKHESFARYMLYLYNLHTQRGKYIQNCNLNMGSSGEIIHYNASLLSLKSANVVRPTD